MSTHKEEIKRVIKLTTGELIIGSSEAIDDIVRVQIPYSIYETFNADGTQAVACMPYEFPYLMEPMKFVDLRAFDIMWSKKLEDFPQIESQYTQATTGIVSEQASKIVL